MCLCSEPREIILAYWLSNAQEECLELSLFAFVALGPLPDLLVGFHSNSDSALRRTSILSHG
jgi:hypothetical protein